MFGGGGREKETLGRMTQMMMPLPSLAMVGGGSGGEEEFARRDERVPQWSQQETRDFIGIRAELEKDFTMAKRNKTLWEIVAVKMKERGYKRTPGQCKCKWKNLVNRYKGQETSDADNGRSCPFFEELHAVFTERGKNMQQRLLLETEAGSVQLKKRAKRVSGYQSCEDISEDEDEDEYESNGERIVKENNPRKRKVEREKQSQTSALERPPSGQLNTRILTNNSGSGGSTIQEILRDFFQQQQMIEMQWRESMEKRAYETQLFEQEWRQSMEKLERVRMVIEQAWREREEQRRMREEKQSETRDALLTTLLNKLIHENHL